MEEARQLFRDKERTEFVIVTIPTVMAMAESERLAASLQTEHVPVKRIVVNQMVCFCWAPVLCASAPPPLPAAALPRRPVLWTRRALERYGLVSSRFSAGG